MSTTWPVRDRLTMAACPMIRPCLQCVLPGRRDESRRVVADDSHERGREHLHQLPARSRSPQQQAEHVHLLVATRLVAEQFEQQRQLKPVLPSSRGRRRAVRTRHQRVCDIHATFHTRGRRRRTNDIANAPFWLFLNLLRKKAYAREKAHTHIHPERAVSRGGSRRAAAMYRPGTGHAHAAAESVVVALHSGSFCQPPPTRVGRNQ